MHIFQQSCSYLISAIDTGTFYSIYFPFLACAIDRVDVGVEVKGRSANVTFSADPSHPQVTYRCRLDNSNFEDCEYYIFSMFTSLIILHMQALVQ